jgi:MFS family permease
LADRLGKAKVLIIALAIFTIAGTAGFLTDSFALLLASRFILGVGLAGISLTATALIGEYYGGMQRSKVIGYQTAATGVGTLLMETVGGALADIGCNYPFLIYLIGAPIIAFGLLSVRDSSRIVRDDRGEAPMSNVPADTGGMRKVIICYAAVFLEMFLMFTAPMNFSYYIAEMDQPYIMMGILLGIMGFTQAVFSIIYTRRISRPSDPVAFSLAFMAMGIALAMLYVQFLPITFVSMVVMGCSMGMLMPTVISRLSMLSTYRTSGKIMGGYAVFINMSIFVCSLVFAPLLAVMGSYCSSYLFLGVFALIVAAVVFVSGRLGVASR